MQKELQPFLERKQYIGVLRDVGLEDDYIFGVPVALNDKFLVIQEISEFYLYGYSILPLYTIIGVKRDAADAYVDHILRQEKILDQVGMKFEIALDDWGAVFRSLMETKLAVTVQCEELGDDYYFIGPVKQVDIDAVWVHYFDPEGVLADSWDDIPFEDITRVGFDEPYANMYSKHLRSLN